MNAFRQRTWGASHELRSRPARPLPGPAPAGGSLSFAGPNESKQSKRPAHRFGWNQCLQAGAVFDAARSSARFLADPSSLRDFMGRKSVLKGRLRFNALGGWATRSETLDGEQSKCEPPEVRSRYAASKSTRKRSELLGGNKPRALTSQTSGQIGIQALCFGDFHLCQQMKVTRPPGRDPATPVGVNMLSQTPSLSQDPARC